ncbi:MAG TPA: hypothetical protein VFU97_17475 [Xanthobacteraceae bacterium]|nr:hypothetical protein [Xanthobacteraceae bacterium]
MIASDIESGLIKARSAKSRLLAAKFRLRGLKRTDVLGWNGTTVLKYLMSGLNLEGLVRDLASGTFAANAMGFREWWWHKPESALLL